MNAFTAGQSLLRSWWGGQAAAPATPVLRPNFTLEAVKLVGRDRGRKVTVFDGLSAVFPRGRNVAVFCDGKLGAESLVRLLTGLERPQSGKISRNARMSWPMSFAGYLMPDCTMRENTLFLARLYGEDTRQVAAFVRDLLEVTVEFEKKISEIPPELKKKLAATIVLAMDFDCYILDGTIGVRDDDFLDRWERVLEARLRTADVVQITTRRRGLLGCHEVGALLQGSTVQFYPTVEAALSEFTESGEEMSGIEVPEAGESSEAEGEALL